MTPRKGTLGDKWRPIRRAAFMAYSCRKPLDALPNGEQKTVRKSSTEHWIGTPFHRFNTMQVLIQIVPGMNHSLVGTVAVDQTVVSPIRKTFGVSIPT